MKLGLLIWGQLQKGGILVRNFEKSKDERGREGDKGTTQKNQGFE